MLVIYSKCKTRLRVSGERIRPEGSKLKCPNCGVVFIFIVKKTSDPAIKERDISKPFKAQAEKDTGADYKESTHHSPENRERRKNKRLSFRENILIDGTKQAESMDISEGGIQPALSISN